MHCCFDYTRGSKHVSFLLLGTLKLLQKFNTQLQLFEILKLIKTLHLDEGEGLIVHSKGTCFPFMLTAHQCKENLNNIQLWNIYICLTKKLLVWCLICSLQQNNNKKSRESLIVTEKKHVLFSSIQAFLADVVACFCRCWLTEWTCPTARWAASCAAAPDRHCLPASWCVTQIYTHPLTSTCCTTPSIIFSWLLQCWSVHSQKKSVCFHCLSTTAIVHLTLTNNSFRCPTRLCLKTPPTLLRQSSLSTILSQRANIKVALLSW